MKTFTRRKRAPNVRQNLQTADAAKKKEVEDKPKTFRLKSATSSNFGRGANKNRDFSKRLKNANSMLVTEVKSGRRKVRPESSLYRSKSYKSLSKGSPKYFIQDFEPEYQAAQSKGGFSAKVSKNLKISIFHAFQFLR